MIGDGSGAGSAATAGLGADAPGFGLDDRLHELLRLPSDDPSRTWGERVAEALVTAAARGDARAWSVLFRRVGAGATTEAAAAGVDDETARKILEVVRGRVDAQSPD